MDDAPGTIEDVLSSWGLPEDVIKVMKDRGLDLYSLQHASDALLGTLVPHNNFASLVKIITKRTEWIKTKVQPVSECTGASIVKAFPNIIMEDDSDTDINVPCGRKTPIPIDTKKSGENREQSPPSKRLSDPDIEQKPDQDQSRNKKPEALWKSGNGEKLDLYSLLQRSAKGRKIWAYYEKNKKLDQTRRNNLNQVIVDEEQRENSLAKVSYERFDSIADEIIKLFPMETKQVWVFTTKYPNGKTQLGGKLYNRYYNSRRHNSVIGLNDTSAVSTPEDDEMDKGTDDTNVLTDCTNTDLIYLRKNAVHSPKLLEAWTNTQEVRLNFNKKKKTQDENVQKVITYMKAFPALFAERGITLLEMDFDFLHPGHSMDFFNQWKKFASFVCRKVQETTPDFLKDAVYTTSEENVQVLLNVSKIFRPILIAKKKKNAKQLDEWKSTRVTSQDGFLMHIEDVRLLHEKLTEREQKLKRYGLMVQTIPVVVGPVEKPIQYLIVLDNFHYEAASPIQAIDLAFKLYHAVNAHYPPEAQHIWMFLQRAVYNIPEKPSRIFGDVEALINEYSQFQI